MTAPVYEDKDVVDGFTLADFQKIVKESETDSLVQRVATATIIVWKARDSARETAALQDAGIHGMQGRLWALTKLWAAVKTFQERGYESGFKEMNEAIQAMLKFEGNNG